VRARRGQRDDGHECEHHRECRDHCLRSVASSVNRRAKKKEAGGHKTDAMLDLYDHEVAVVEPAQAGEAEGVL
jgi:hypothetical protein